MATPLLMAFLEFPNHPGPLLGNGGEDCRVHLRDPECEGVTSDKLRHEVAAGYLLGEAVIQGFHLTQVLEESADNILPGGVLRDGEVSGTRCASLRFRTGGLRILG